MKQIPQGNWGFTLFEMVISITVLVIIGIFVIGSVGKPARLLHEYQARTTADSDARRCMATILSLLRSAVPGSIAITNDDPETTLSTNAPNTHISFIYRPAGQTANTASPTYDIYLTSKQPAEIHLRVSLAGAVIQVPKTLASNASYLQINQNPTDQTLLDISLKLSAPLSGDNRTHDVEILNQYVRVGSSP